jgi:YHS domain-containing protein
MISKKIVGAVVLSGILASLSISAAERPAQAGKEQKLKPYPLKTCLVTDEKLGEMGEPFVYKYQGREIKFCCKSCLKDFNKEPAKYIKKLEEAEKKAQKGAKEAKPATPSAHSSHSQ